MAIHPYPADMGEPQQLPDGTNMLIRPIRPEDAEMEQRFVHDLSEQSKYFRFMQALRELTPEMLVRFTQIDYDREMAFVAVRTHNGREQEELGVARYSSKPDGESCEFALVVADDWHHKGIGTRLMQTLMEAAKAQGLEVMEGEILSNNHDMLSLVRHLGFTTHTSPDDDDIQIARREL
jgi:acetyltransferase